MLGSLAHTQTRASFRLEGADEEDASDPPWTPVVYIVLWVSVTVGFARGYDHTAALMAFQTSDFLRAVNKGSDADSAWCTAGSEGLINWFQGIILAINLIAPPAAAHVCRVWGRKAGLFLGGILGIAGQVLCGSAFGTPQLLIGLYISVLASPILYLATILADVEMAPQPARGRFLVAHNVGYAIGGLAGEALSLVVLSVPSRHNLWRMVILFGALPYAVILMLLPWLYESPASLLQMGKMNEGWAALKELRGPFHDGVWAEYQSLVSQVQGESGVKHRFSELLERHNLPGLLLALAMSCLASHLETVSLTYISQQAFIVAGVGRLGFLVPGFTLVGSILFGLTIALILVDWAGRVPCLVTGSASCLLCTTTVFGMVLTVLRPGVERSVTWAASVLIFLSWFKASLSIGWFSVIWLVVAELQALRVRTTVLGLAMALFFLANSVLNFVLLCKLKSRVSGVIAATQLIALVLSLTCIPETKGTPLGGSNVLKKHWLWKRFYEPPRKGKGAAEEGRGGLPRRSSRGTSGTQGGSEQGSGPLPPIAVGAVGGEGTALQTSPVARASVPEGQLAGLGCGWYGQGLGPAGFGQSTDEKPQQQQQLVQLAGGPLGAASSVTWSASVGSGSVAGKRRSLQWSSHLGRGAPAAGAPTQRKRALVSAALQEARNVVAGNRGRKDDWDEVDAGTDDIEGDEVMEDLRQELQEEPPQAVWAPLSSADTAQLQGRLNRLFTRGTARPSTDLPGLLSGATSF